MLCGLTPDEVRSRLLVPGPPVRVRLLPLGGESLLVRPGTSDVRVLEDTYAGLYHLPPADVSEPRLIVDLGSNIGATILHFGHLYPGCRILGVEMDAESARLCAANVASLGHRVRLVHAAVAARDGLARYDREEGVEPWAYRIRPGGSGCVRSMSLDSLLAGEPTDAVVDYLKMDVEGAECEILRAGGAWASRVRCLKVEVHEPYEVEEAARDLASLGFSCRIDRRHFACVVGTRPPSGYETP